MTWILTGSQQVPADAAERIIAMLESGKGMVCLPEGATLTYLPSPLPWWPVYAPFEQAQAAWWAASLNMDPVE